ncbi:nickel pincer cofactor biosynthesis protein LarB [Robertmurraya massiliosenegalensis]|uniref:nickel pincer cofactor biosynthesis protein LarB n=1 Tax=Robertmurraya TaxID=2837507 RepID=UPI0039A59D7B
MDNSKLERILQSVKKGETSIEDARSMLTQFEDLGFAKIDYNRPLRTGFPEVIYGEGKTSEQIISIFQTLIKKNRRVLATRISKEKAKEILTHVPDAAYFEDARAVIWIGINEPVTLFDGYVAVLCGGTSDIPVAEEAAVTAEAMGCEVQRIYDVGVAGIHRLFHHLDTIRGASAIIAVAGMEGALPSVVSGLVAKPVFAVPTSIGYGANFNGISALLSMLNACAPGISVVNIDNGFGAGYNAALVLSMALKKEEVHEYTTL